MPKRGYMKTKYGLLNIHSGGIDLTEFQEMVAVNAYYRAEKRGFEASHEMDDWLEAIKEIKHLHLTPVNRTSESI